MTEQTGGLQSTACKELDTTEVTQQQQQQQQQQQGVSDGQGGLARCSPWGHKESGMTE